MLGSTHGTLTTGFRARVVACGEEPHAAVVSLPTATVRGGLDVSGRPLHLTVPDLDRFFRPRSVAVVGASDAEGRPNTGITRQLIAWAERVGARLHPVHPRRQTVFGHDCFPSVTEVPEPVDLAVLLVADPLPVIEELGEAEVPFAVAFASGFAETGEAGAAAQDRLAQDLAEAAEATDKLVCVVWGSPVGTEDAYRTTLLGSSRLATFRTARNCVTAVKAYLDHHRFADRYRSPFEDAPRAPSPSFRKAQSLLRPGQQLSEHAAKQLLRAYGIRVPREQLVTSAAAAVRAAGPVGYPVVMKASGPRLAHKTELGLVKVGLTSASQVRDAYRELTDIARYESVDLDGVLVCQMIDRGVEMMAGVTHDALFGPTVTVGLGGVLVEVLHDTAVRVPPFGEQQARDMLGELRGRALLEGVRGGPPVDVDALVEVVLRVQRMALELGADLTELDINPLVVLGRGQGAVALDALAVCR
jgi:acyl-CoA synthetase (NDP forming)